MNLVLTGLRGSGKTKLGALLAKKLKWPFIDLDVAIEKQEKMKIAKIVELHGWEYFRKKENEVTKKVSEADNTIIATGGGTVLDRENEKALKANGKIIYLYRKPEDCIKYIENDPNRPPLTANKTLAEEMDELYKERNGCYCKSAIIIFHRTEDLKEDVDNLIEQIFENNDSY